MERKTKMQPSRLQFTQKKPTWVTKQIAEEGSREIFLKITLREILLYIIFILLITTLTLGMMYPSMFYLTKVLHELFVQKSFPTTSNVHITFYEIKTAADFWSFSENIFDGFHWDYWYDSVTPVEETSEDDKKILYENKLLGVPRFRQLKVRNDSCIIHEYFRRMFLTCYGKFTRDAEDTSSFGSGEGSAWNFNSELATGSISYQGKVASYHGGGYIQDLSPSRNKTSDIIAELKQNLWITRGTRCIFLDFAVYNGNLNLFCVVKLIFEFPPTGGVIPSSSLKTVKLIRYASVWDYFIAVCELLFFCFIIFYTIEEVHEIIYFGWLYFLKFWNYVDMFLLTLAYSCFVLAIILQVIVADTLKEYLYVVDKYANLEYVASLQVTFNNMIAILLFISYIKIFKYLSFNKVMSQLNNTLSKCALDIMGFSVMFFIIFFAYAELGYLLFGTEVMGFSSFGIATFTLLRTILGDFDYMEIENANRVLAPVYFLSYIFFVFFVLLNMFLAIINDTYSDVKTEISVAPDEMQMSEYLTRGFYKFLNKCGCAHWIPKKKEEKTEYNVTIEQIRGALKRCGFTDLEIEMFFARYNIDPTAEVGEFDINKLMANLEQGSHEIPTTTRVSMDSVKEGLSETNISVKDFLAQQERLAEIENTIAELTNKVDTLLQKLDTLNNVRKSRKPP